MLDRDRAQAMLREVLNELDAAADDEELRELAAELEDELFYLEEIWEDEDEADSALEDLIELADRICEANAALSGIATRLRLTAGTLRTELGKR